MMGLAIAHEVREQVVFVNEPIEVNPVYRFDIEKMRMPSHDDGDQMVVV